MGSRTKHLTRILGAQNAGPALPLCELEEVTSPLWSSVGVGDGPQDPLLKVSRRSLDYFGFFNIVLISYGRNTQTAPFALLSGSK